MSDWRVMVVEDDRVIAGLHCKFVSRVDGFSVVGVAGTVAQAEQMIPALKPDLLLLDLGLPDQSGIALLRRLRARGDLIEAIAVTAATATPLVRATVHLGVVDYLVKPFDQERLRKALALFRRRMAMLSSAQLVQSDVDRICSDGPNSHRWLPRDLSIDRLRQIQQAFATLTEPVTAAEVAARTGVSRVTARRYLEYLVTVGQAEMSAAGSGPGRPTKTYLPTSAVGDVAVAMNR
jgi:response regulator of citrate/malate metabolism